MPRRRLLHDARVEAGGAAPRDDVVVEPRRVSAREKDERLRGEGAEGDAGLARDPMRARHGGDHRIGVNELHVEQSVRVRRHAVKQSEVDAPVAKSVGLGVGVHLEERDPDVRQVHAEEAEHFGQHARVGGGFDEADAQASDLSACRAFGGALGTCRLREREARFGEKGAPRRGERHTARDALEQRRADLALEVADLTGKRRLCDMEPRRRSAEVELFGDGDEVPEMAEFHTRKVSPITKDVLDCRPGIRFHYR